MRKMPSARRSALAFLCCFMGGAPCCSLGPEPNATHSLHCFTQLLSPCFPLRQAEKQEQGFANDDEFGAWFSNPAGEPACTSLFA